MRVYLDTCCVIYLLENVAGYSANIRRRLNANPEAIICVSPLVRLEALVKPLLEGDNALVDDYEYFLGEQEWLSHDDATFEFATEVRVKYRIKTPDALHLATAVRHGCGEFWTNDQAILSTCPLLDLKVMVIDDFLSNS